MQPSARGPALSLSKGFTLIELLIVISIIAVLSVIGIVVFTNVQKGARDSKRKADINAIAKAYEVKYNSSGSYPTLTDADFASGKPKDPNSTKGDYFNWLDSTGAGFKVCASLEANPNNACNTPATNCYCMVSAQGTVNSASANPSGSTQTGIGFGGSSSPSCDPNGTLLSGLVGYWKMDDPPWTGAPNEVKDSSGYNNNGTAVNGANTTAAGIFGRAGSFDLIKNDYLTIPKSSSLNADGQNQLTVSVWVRANRNYGDEPAGVDDYINYGACALHYNGWNNASQWQCINQNNVNSIVTDGSHLNANEVHNFVGVLDTNQVRFYKDGNLLPGSVSFSGTLGNGAGVDISRSRTFDGIIDDVRVYNRVLSSSEISSLYNSGSGCLP